jgi:hypothetical protein
MELVSRKVSDARHNELKTWPTVSDAKGNTWPKQRGMQGMTLRFAPGSRRVWSDRMPEPLAKRNEGEKWQGRNAKRWLQGPWRHW